MNLLRATVARGDDPDRALARLAIPARFVPVVPARSTELHGRSDGCRAEAAGRRFFERCHVTVHEDRAAVERAGIGNGRETCEPRARGAVDQLFGAEE